ncbi:peptidoglycan DD-metalloendopeptidase family protein [Hwanghaeella grinnelliae]|uniref:peptidoglycan DD-metalloendopeptidase family protein n=1 Tax=Hwanghaeella grinnelliae TaxID=2500179 RepID=UPI001386D758|nr:peptidoglycan DD-metalloendopeptidase family protein [Hwanghaeella grinnelliae]
MGSSFGQSSFDNEDEAGRNRVGAFFRRVFRERELILRSEGQVSYLRLSSRLQMGVAGACLAVVLWAGAVSGAAYWQKTVIDDKHREIGEAKLAIEDLRDDMTTYQQQIATATKSLSARASKHGDGTTISAHDLQEFRNELGAIDDLNIKLSSLVEQINVDVDADDPERARIIASRQVLHDRIDLLRRTLSETRERETDLAVNVKQMTSRVDTLSKQKHAVAAERNKLEARLAELDSQLLESRTRVGDLSRDLRQTRTELRTVMAGRDTIEQERLGLISRVSVLEKSLLDARNRGDGLAVNLTALERRLDEAREAKTNSELVKEDTARKLAQVGRLLEGTRNRQAGIENRLVALVTEIEAVTDSQVRGDDQLTQSHDEVAALELAVSAVLNDIAKTRDAKAEAERTLDDVVAELGVVAGVDTKKQIATEDPVKATRKLLATIRELHESQEQVVVALIDKTDRQIKRAERILGLAGLGPVEMAALGIPTNEGQGGPFFALDFEGGSAQDLEINVATLSEKAEQWEAYEEVMACMPLIPPVDNYQFTSGFGKRRDPINGKMAVHEGVDLAGWPKTPIYATAPGEVIYAGRNGKYGKSIVIDHGCGVTTRYAHLHTILVKKGDMVPHRFEIAKMGSTGRSTGPHVHYEIVINNKPVDPAPFFEAGRLAYKG